jgi:hypothetical protein
VANTFEAIAVRHFGSGRLWGKRLDARGVLVVWVADADRQTVDVVLSCFT